MGSEPQDGEHASRPMPRLVRSGPLISVLVGAVILFAQLGATGLWEPWEMDRADVARALASPPQVVGALQERELTDTLRTLTERGGVVLRVPELTTKTNASQSIRLVREALKRAQESVTSHMFIDETLLWSEGASTGVWDRAAGLLNDAAATTLTKTVSVLVQPSTDVERVRVALTAAMVRTTYGALVEDYALPQVTWPKPEVLVTSLTTSDHLAPIQLIRVDDEDALLRAIDDAHTDAYVARFRKDRVDFTVPPLQPWLTAASYRLLGASETSTRLPTAILAWLALAVLVFAARHLYGAPVATVAGVVGATTPLLVAQGRLVMGEAGAILGFVLVMMALLFFVRGTLKRLAWLMLILGFVVGLASKGLTAALCVALIAGVSAAIAPKEGRALWGPSVVLLTMFALLTAWVLSSAPDSAASQLRFTLPLFSDGPTAYQRNFDFAIKSIGFGLFPWTPLMVVAMAWLTQRAVEKRHIESLLIVVGFSVSAFIAIGFFRDYNHLMWPGAPMVALAIALAWRHSDDLLGPQRVMSAFVVLVVGFILSRELGKDPAPIAGFLTYDPPFDEGSKLQFPSDLSLKTASRMSLILVILPAFLWLARPLEALRPWLHGLRSPSRLTWLVSTVVVLAPVIWLIQTLVVYGHGMNSSAASTLSVAQRGWYLRHILGGDPLASLALGTVVGLVLIGLVRYIFLRRRLQGVTFKRIEALSAVWVGLIGVGGLSLGLHMLWIVWPEPGAQWPPAYWSTTLWHIEAVVALFAALTGAYLCRAHGPALMFLMFLGVLGLILGTRLSRDLMWFPPIAMALNGVVGLGWIGLVMPGCMRGLGPYLTRASWLVAGSILMVLAPLFDRWLELSSVLFGGRQDDLLDDVVLRSRLSWLLLATVGALLINRWLPETVGWVMNSTQRLITSTRLVMLLVALGAGGYVSVVLSDFYPSLAHHVSQKHILDTYADVAGQAEHELFKHGRFNGSTGRDVNFYTSRLPAVKEKDRALRALLAQSDQVVVVETPNGSEARLLPGWDARNDADSDGRRDQAALAGIATSVSGSEVVVEDADWAVDEHVGKVLVGVKGTTYPIASNTATTLTLTGSKSPVLRARSADPLSFVIDQLDSPSPRSSASEPVRRFMLLPSGSLSELNHAYRKLSGGGHLNILDGRSSRVLLASTWLDPNQEQQNRYANHTIDRAAFDALPDGEVNRVWVDFDGKLKVVGYKLESDTVGRGVPIKLTVYFEVLKRVSSSQKIFMHIDKQGSTGRIHADHWPLNMATGEKPQEKCVGCYRTDHWFKGDVVLDYFEKEVAPGTASGLYDIWMGLYSPSNDKRLKVKDWQKGLVRHDGSNRVSIGTLRVR